MRAGHVVNISRLTVLVSNNWCPVGSQAVRTVVFKLEREGVLVRESVDGATRFRWNWAVAPMTADMMSRHHLDELARLAMQRCDWATVKSCNAARFATRASQRNAARARCAIAWTTYHSKK